MAVNFNQRIKVSPNLSLNLSKSGITPSIKIGPVTINPVRGTTTITPVKGVTIRVPKQKKAKKTK